MIYYRRKESRRKLSLVLLFQGGLTMVAQRQPRYMTVDEWRELERARPDAKYEYIDGQVYLMSGGSLAHSRISNNTIRALEDALGSKPCYVYNSDASVRLSETRYTYPDASVSCDPGDQPTTEQMQIQAPRVVVEVLSDSTEGRDRMRKANFYHACPTIQEYVLIATRYQAAEVQRRSEDGWTLHLFGPGDEIEFVSIGVRFPLAVLYRGTTVPEMLNDQDEPQV
jgi:Uma2 family endonuclease